MNHNDGFIGNGFFILGRFFHSKRPSKKLVRQYGGSEKGLRLRKGLPDVTGLYGFVIYGESEKLFSNLLGSNG